MRARHAPVITIDGPNASGKGAISGRVASRLGWHLLDSGALYRVLAHAAVERGIGLGDEPALAALAPRLGIRFATAGPGEPVRVQVDGRDVSAAIRAEGCGGDASRIAALPGVRGALLDRQRAFRQPPGLVADGRDMGTVVFTDAEAKIFLTASPRERAERRYKQLKEKGIGVSLATLSTEIAERDERDRERTSAPTKPAEDALTIDTTGLEIEAVVVEVMRWAEVKGLRSE